MSCHRWRQMWHITKYILSEYQLDHKKGGKSGPYHRSDRLRLVSAFENLFPTHAVLATSYDLTYWVTATTRDGAGNPAGCRSTFCDTVIYGWAIQLAKTNHH
jgi:hypothetical protein